jgi:hypothetical protein
MGSFLAKQLMRGLAKESGQGFAGVLAGGHMALVTGKPNFSDGILCGDLVKPGMQVSVTPHFADKIGLDEKGRELYKNGGPADTRQQCLCFLEQSIYSHLSAVLRWN